MVVLDALGRSEKLPEGKTVGIEFTPEAPGELVPQTKGGVHG